MSAQYIWMELIVLLFWGKAQYNLKCFKCMKDVIVQIDFGSRCVIYNWSYSCGSCGYKDNENFSFLDKIVSCFVIPVPLVVGFIPVIQKVSGSFQEKYHFILFAGVFLFLFLFGMFLSKKFTKFRVKHYLKNNFNNA
ncbi:hypothetical protein MNBD_UNCLBAC01-608 [hydrothermal vent metagenome]|uniref:Uncharacterized protein n=1 Tax=hydrothermal vent metagenome TaxID=652676 RepID=A0A3B1CXE2_9ZZZZ